MSCTTISTETLLACFFASEKSKELKLKRAYLKTIHQLETYLANNLPGYVFRGLQYTSIESAIEKMALKTGNYHNGKAEIRHNFFRIINNIIVYDDNGYSIDIDYYLMGYEESVKKNILLITSGFLERRCF